MRDYHSNKHDCLHTTQSLPFPAQVGSAGGCIMDWGEWCVQVSACMRYQHLTYSGPGQVSLLHALSHLARYHTPSCLLLAMFSLTGAITTKVSSLHCTKIHYTKLHYATLCSYIALQFCTSAHLTTLHYCTRPVVP